MSWKEKEEQNYDYGKWNISVFICDTYSVTFNEGLHDGDRKTFEVYDVFSIKEIIWSTGWDLRLATGHLGPLLTCFAQWIIPQRDFHNLTRMVHAVKCTSNYATSSYYEFNFRYVAVLKQTFMSEIDRCSI